MKSFLWLVFLGLFVPVAWADPLVVLAHNNFAPHVYQDENGRPAGFAADFLNLVADDLGVELVWQFYPTWPELIGTTETEPWDLIANFGQTEWRRESFLFSLPYETFAVVPFVRASNPAASLNDLSGKPIAVVKINVGRELMQGDPRFSLQVYPSREEALFELLSGRVEGLIYPKPTLLALARQSGVEDQIRPLDETLVEVKRAVAFPLGAAGLKKRFDRSIDRLIRTEAYGALYARWLAPKPPPWTPRQVMLGAGILLVLIAGALVVWRFVGLSRVNSRLRWALEQESLAQDRLNNSQLRFQHMVEYAPFPLIAFAQGGEVLAVSRVFCRLSGYRPEQLPTIRDWVQLAYPDRWPEEEVHFESLHQLDEPVNEAVHQIRTAEGGHRSWAFSSAPLPDLPGQEGVVVSMAVDLTENLALERELQTSQESYRALVEHAIDPILTFNDQGDLVQWNHGAEQLWGVSTSAALRQKIETLLRDSRSGKTWLKRLQERLEPGQSLPPQEWLALHAMGTMIPLEGSVACWDSPGGRFYSGVFKDLRERKAAEAEILALNRQLEARVEQRTLELQQAQEILLVQEKLSSLGRMTSGIAHEIRNPLNFIQNFAEVLVERALMLPEERAQRSPSELQIAEKIVEYAQLIGSIISSMLLHARKDPGYSAETALHPLVEQYLNLAIHGFKSKQPDLRPVIERHFDPDLPLVPLYPQEFGRVVLNLLSNAFDAVSEKCRRSGEDYRPRLILRSQRVPGGVGLRVYDNGVGIPLEQQSRVFEPFCTTKPAGQGTGLGLSICFDVITRLHEGHIELSSEPGEYTEVQVFLPLERSGKGAAGRP